MPIIDDIDIGETNHLGTFNFDLPSVGDVTIPGLININVNIPSLMAHGLPSQGFTIAGSGIGALRIGGFGAPAASVDSVMIGRVHGDAFPVPNLTLSNLALPSASVADIVGQGIDSVATPFGNAPHLDLGCLDLTLKIKPRAEAHIDQLTISGLTASTSIGTIELHDVVAPTSC